MILPSSPIKILGKSVKGFMSYDRTYKQTDNRDYNFINIDWEIMELVLNVNKNIS